MWTCVWRGRHIFALKIDTRALAWRSSPKKILPHVSVTDNACRSRHKGLETKIAKRLIMAKELLTVRLKRFELQTRPAGGPGGAPFHRRAEVRLDLKAWNS